MRTNYSDHAAYWDWDAFDDSESYDFWLKMSRKYGHRLLSPMCALGQAAAYMAKNGCEVVGLDYTEEMVREGSVRFGNVKGLKLVQADVCNFSLEDRAFDFCFLASSDIHLLPSIEAVGNALECIGRHLRSSGGLGVEIRLPDTESYSTPSQTFHPRVPRTTGPKVWKESASQYDANTMVQRIEQRVFVERDGEVRSFEHKLELHFYREDMLLDVFNQSGYDLVARYADIDFSPCSDEPDGYFAEFVRK